MRYLRYLQYIIRHKWFVAVACLKYGLWFEAIIHDLSKLLPDEFFPYANHFYGPGADIHKGRDSTGYYKPTDTGDRAFDFAWLLHQKRNTHHWQWWCLLEDEGGLKVLEMSVRARKEMVADWQGAGKALGTPDTRAWYYAHKHIMSLGIETRVWIEKKLDGLGIV